MIGDVAASVSFHQLYAESFQLLRGDEKMLGVRTSPQCDDRRTMFQQQQGIGYSSLSPLPDEFALVLPCRGVVYTAQPLNMQKCHRFFTGKDCTSHGSVVSNVLSAFVIAS